MKAVQGLLATLSLIVLACGPAPLANDGGQPNISPPTGMAAKDPVGDDSAARIPQSTAAQGRVRPSDGFSLHVDAKHHFPANPDMIAHHWCKPVRGMTQCLLFDGDGEDARVVGAEMIVSPQAYQGLSEREQARWHYHKTEIPKVEATLPDLSEDEAAVVVKSLEETYGKVFILFDPAGDAPEGLPTVTILQ